VFDSTAHLFTSYKLVFAKIYLPTKFEVAIFIRSKDSWLPKFQKEGHMTHATPLWLYL